MNEVTVVNITSEQEEDLRRYSEVLMQYVSPNIRTHSPIGSRKGSRTDMIIAQRVAQERELLQRKLGIGGQYALGRWKLENVGNIREPPAEDYLVPYDVIFPLRCNTREFLDFLADKTLSHLFPHKRLAVADTYTPCNGDCSWDCA